MKSCAVACSSLSTALRFVEVAVSQELLREKACQDCVTDHAMYARLGCNEGSQMSPGAMSRTLLNPIPDWLALRAACVMLSSVRPGKPRSRDRCPISSVAAAALCSSRIVWP